MAIQIVPGNSRYIRTQLKHFYSLEDNTAVRAFIEDLAECVAAALREYAAFQISEDGLLGGLEALLFGKKDAPASKSFAALENGRELPEEERVAQKILKVALMQDMPDEEGFTKTLNEAVAEKKGQEEFSIYEFLEDRLKPTRAEARDQTLDDVAEKDSDSDDISLPDSVSEGTLEAELFRALKRLVIEPEEYTPGDEIGLQSELAFLLSDELGWNDPLRATSVFNRLARKGLFRRKQSGQTYKLIWRPDLADSVSEGSASEESGETEGSEVEGQAQDPAEPARFDRQSRLSDGQKLVRIVYAFRQVRRQEDYCQSRTVDGTLFVYAGRKDLAMEEVEAFGGLSESQRKSAIRKAEKRDLIDRDGKYSSETSYYLRADLAEGELPSADELLEGDIKQDSTDAEADKPPAGESSPSEEKENSSAAAETEESSYDQLFEQAKELRKSQLPSLDNPSAWKDRIEQVREIGEQVKETKSEIHNRIAELEIQFEHLDDLQGELGDLLQLFNEGRRTARE